jgi:hypothetical protein
MTTLRHQLLDVVMRLPDTPSTYAEVGRCGDALFRVVEESELVADLQKLGAAFEEIYLQALNGVACDPGAERGPRSQCDACYAAWTAGREVLKKYDSQAGNMYRSGPLFQPDLTASAEEGS